MQCYALITDFSRAESYWLMLEKWLRKAPPGSCFEEKTASSREWLSSPRVRCLEPVFDRCVWCRVAPCNESGPKTATNNVTKAGESHNWMSRFWQLGVKNPKKERKKRKKEKKKEKHCGMRVSLLSWHPDLGDDLLRLGKHPSWWRISDTVPKV